MRWPRSDATITGWLLNPNGNRDAHDMARKKFIRMIENKNQPIFQSSHGGGCSFYKGDACFWYTAKKKLYCDDVVAHDFEVRCEHFVVRKVYDQGTVKRDMPKCGFCWLKRIFEGAEYTPVSILVSFQAQALLSG